MDQFLLILFRMGAFLAAVPIFGQTLKNKTVKSVFAIFLAIVVFPVSVDPGFQEPANLLTYVAMVMKEILIGIYLSFIVAITFAAVRIAGDLIGLEMGLAFAAQADPVTGQQTPLVAYFFEVMAVLVFFSLDFHLWMIQGVAESLSVMPVGTMDFAKFTPEALLDLFRQMVKTAMVVAAPVFIVMAMVSLCMGLLAKAVPNFNIMDAGYTMRVGMAMLSMFIFIPGFLESVADLFTGLRESMFTAVRALV